MAQKNPIAQRLEILADQWAEFATREDARLLRWVLRSDEVRMVDAFLAVESDERAGEYPDLFLTLDTAFADPDAHGFSLRQTLATGYREGEEDLREDGVDADWQPPAAGSEEDDIPYFVRTCVSFADHYRLPRHLTVVLRPTTVADARAYQDWLSRLVVAAPQNLRFVALDDVGNPGYDDLEDRDPERVVSQAAALDVPAALEELSKSAGGQDTPGGKYRDLFVRIGKAVGEQDLARAVALGDKAEAIADAEGWFHLTVPVHFTLAAGFLGQRCFEEAIARYQAAEAAARRGEYEGPDEAVEACRVLKLRSRLGHGSVLVATNDWAAAALHYEAAAPLAVEADDRRALLDCFRLASFCHEQNKNRADAWRLGMVGLEIAREMDQETLESSSFSYLGDGLMRLAKKRPYHKLRDQTERDIAAVAGREDWRPAQSADRADRA